MIVTVFCDNNETPRLEAIQKIFNRIKTKLNFCPVEPHWYYCGQEDDFITCLRHTTHALLYISQAQLSTNWFHYLSGYLHGKAIPTLVFSDKKMAPDDQICRNFKYYSDPDQIEAYFKEQQQAWQIQDRIERTREQLAGLEIPFTKEGLIDCVREGNANAVLLFLKAGLSANLKDKKGVTLLALAVRNGHRNVIPHLLHYNAGINTISEDRGNTPLMDAAAGGDQEILLDLIRAGSELDIQSKIGQTALMLAIGRGAETCADILIRAGANVTIKDNLGMTALKYAELFHHSGIMKLIKHVNPKP